MLAEAKKKDKLPVKQKTVRKKYVFRQVFKLKPNKLEAFNII
jgi:hypothetical protein